jgi:hypothetical protein
MSDETNPAPEATGDVQTVVVQPGPAYTEPPAEGGEVANSDHYVAPPEGAESGHAVYDVDLGQFVSGVMSKSDANDAAKVLRADPPEGESRITDGHKLEVRRV